MNLFFWLVDSLEIDFGDWKTDIPDVFFRILAQISSLQLYSYEFYE
jgi:hypothetical protein